MPENMKCVMIFDPKDSDEDTATKFINWLRDNNRIPDEHSLEKTLFQLESENETI